MHFALRPIALPAAALLLAAAPVHLRGTVERTVDGQHATITVERQDGMRLVRICTAGLCTGSWTAGGRRFTFGVGGVLVGEDGPLGENPAVDEAERAAVPVPGTLEPPPEPAVAFSPAPALALADAAVPIVPCTLAGTAARCLIDTGTSPSAITLGLAERLGLEPHGSLVIAAFGEYATGVVDTGPLQLGGARIAALHLAIAPSDARAGWDVIVGADLLARLRVTLDRAHRRVTVGPSGTAWPGALPLRLHEGLAYLTLALDGAQQDALVDTGDESVVSIGYEAYRAGPQWPIVGRGRARGIAGDDDTLLVAIPAARAGGAALGSVRAVVRRTQPVAHLGIGLWERCAVTVDETARAFGCEAGAAR